MIGDDMDLREELFANQDLKYRDFHSRLCPTVNKENIIGVRVPILRKIAREAYKSNAENLCEYYEEIMVKGLTIGMKKCSAQEHISDLAGFVPLIDNWAVCDCCCSSFKFTDKYREEMYDFIVSYLNNSEYETRFAIIMLMDYYFTDNYIDKSLKLISSINSELYYVNMAAAWALSVAFVKYENKVMDILNSHTLTKEIHNKTIKKICESNRVDKSKKAFIRTYKI